MKKILSKVLLSLIFFLVSIIFIKSRSLNGRLYNKIFFEDEVKFIQINNWYHKYFGDFLPRIDTYKEVYSPSFSYISKEDYLNGTKFYMDKNSLINAFESGVVVFIGDKENLGNTVIIQGDKYDFWYSNINSNLNLYDYVKKDSLIGEIESNSLYLTIMKDNEYISYEEYLKD